MDPSFLMGLSFVGFILSAGLAVGVIGIFCCMLASQISEALRRRRGHD